MLKYRPIPLKTAASYKIRQARFFYNLSMSDEGMYYIFCFPANVSKLICRAIILNVKTCVISYKITQ